MLDLISRYAAEFRKTGLPISALAIQKNFPDIRPFMVGKIFQFLTAGEVQENAIHFESPPPEKPKEKPVKKQVINIRKHTENKWIWFDERRNRYYVKVNKKYLGAFIDKLAAVKRRDQWMVENGMQLH